MDKSIFYRACAKCGATLKFRAINKREIDRAYCKVCRKLYNIRETKDLQEYTDSPALDPRRYT